MEISYRLVPSDLGIRAMQGPGCLVRLLLSRGMLRLPDQVKMQCKCTVRGG